MALSHNSLIRGFNSIYQQAPRLSPSDHKDFICYCLAWHNCVEKHHHYEETLFFPAIEKATGVKGIMDGEVEQHGKLKWTMNAFKTLIMTYSHVPCWYGGIQEISLAAQPRQGQIFAPEASSDHGYLLQSPICSLEKRTPIALSCEEILYARKAD